MKKFTGNFLSGGYRSALRIFRSIALGLVALLWTHSASFAQICPPPPGTVFFYAETVDACYNATNTYKVNVSVADFWNVDSLNLFLDYDEIYWTFKSATVLHDVFKSTQSGAPNSGLQNKPMTISNDGSVLNFKWTEWVTRGQIDSTGVKVPIVELTFELKNFPSNTLPSYVNNLAWTSASTVWKCNGNLTFTQWLGVDYTNGKITTNIAFEDVLYTINPDTVDCLNDNALVTITAPVGTGYKYSFNGGTAWQDSPTASAAPGDHTVQVKDPNGCLSVKEDITVEVRDALEYTTIVTDESCDRLGEILFDATGGSEPYIYWVVPSSDWSLVTQTIQLEGKNAPGLAKYKFNTRSNLRGAGTYYIAVDDAYGCSSMNIEASETTNWTSVTILPGAQFTYTDTVYVDTVTCYNGNDGQYGITINDGYPWIDGYRIFIPGVVDTMIAAGVELIVSDMPVGTYEVVIADSVCSKIEMITINNATPITFYVDYTDAACTADSGSLWISEINGDSIKNVDPAVYASWEFIVKGGGVTDTLAVGDTITSLPANYYSIWLLTDCGSEIAFVNEDGSGNIVPILDDGSILFNTVVTNAVCFPSCDGTIRVTDVTRTCDNCNEGAVYQYRVDGGNWMALTETATGLCRDTFLVEVRDSNDPAVCIVSKDVIVGGPTEALVAYVDTAYAPSCPGGNDGWVKMYVSGGTKPYEYSVDNAPNWRPAPSFGLTEGLHTLRIRDANGCELFDTITVDSIQPIMITAVLLDTVQCTDERVDVKVTLDEYAYYADIADYTWYANNVKFAIDSAGVAKMAPGTYYIYAMDPNGCTSNEDTVVIDNVDPLVVFDPIVEDAECYMTWSGQITLTVSGGNPDSVYYYALANNPDVFTNNNANINWVPFTVNDTIEILEVQKGTYWIQVKDACEKSTPVKAEVDGYDPIDLTKVDVIDVMCNEEKEGTVTATTATGGGPGYGVGNYLYTLRQLSDATTLAAANIIPTYGVVDTIVGSALQESNTWSGLAAGKYRVYVYDETDPTADPAQCAPDSMDVTVKQPAKLEFDTAIKHVSCAGEENGEIYVDIWGGIGGSWNIDGMTTAALTDGKAYEVTINQIKGDYNYSLKLKDAVDTVVFQTMGGDFEIIVMTAAGCTYKDTVTVFEPLPWLITPIVVEPSDCGIPDGVIKAVITGGFDTLDIPGVEISVWFNDTLRSSSLVMGDTITLFNEALYDTKYIIKVVNTESTLNYEVLAADQCVESIDVTIDVYNPFEFKVAVQCAQCYGENNGKVTISDITGGSGKYQIQLVGGENPTYTPGNEDLWWPIDSKGDPSYVTGPVVFDTLAAGDYWIYLRDDSGFTLANCCRPIKFVMCQPDTLKLITVTLEENVACAGDSTGAFSIQATGGEAPYKYAYSRTQTGSDGFPYPTAPADSAFTYTDSIISGLPTGTYIGWVMDANGCITGCEIDASGFPIDDHRVVIQEAGALEWTSVSIVEPKCYGGLADVKLVGVSGGSGDSMTVVLAGKTYHGLDTTYMFGPVATGLGTYTLEDVYASDSMGYVVSVATDADCTAGGDTIWVTQPPVFDVQAVISSNAYCAGDNEVLVVIETEGGTAPFTYDIYKDGTKIRSNSVIVNHVLAVGAEYVVVAKDALGCNVPDTLMIDTPLPVEFTIENITCFGEEKASARITAHGTPGRSFTVKYKQIEDDNHPTNWTYYNGWFTESIEMIDTFIYDNENIGDKHYEFMVEDEYGCESELGIMTFDAVQTELAFDAVVLGDAGECTTTLTVTGKGGIPPYSLWVDSVMMTGLTAEVEAGYHTITLRDANLRCTDVIDSFEVVTNLVIRDTTIYTFYNEEVEFVDSIAGVDSMLVDAELPYEFAYLSPDSTCTRMLYVTVLGKAHTYTIDDIRQDSTITDTSIVNVVGTVTGVYEGGFFMQDANTAGSGIAVASADSVEIGDGVEVEGTVSEVMMVTTLTANKVTFGDATLVVVPIDMTAPSAIEAEMYESMLVSINGARANAVDSAGMWTVYYEVTDVATVNDWLFAYTPVEGNYYNVAGIVNGKDDMFKLEPRMATDVVDITETTEVDPSQTIGFKVYPNPFNDHINIDNSEKLVRLVITNIAGQRVIDVEYPERQIRTAKLVSGVYLVNLFTEKGLVKTDRIIKR